MTDRRGSYAKAKHIHYLLSQLYDLDDIILHEDIEYLITRTYEYYDKRTFEKYFTILEKNNCIIRTKTARPVSKRKKVTKQKSNADTLSFQYFTGQAYCWSEYKLGFKRTQPRSPAPPSRVVSMSGVEKSLKIYVCV